VPPVVWLFLGMYIGIYSLKSIISMNLFFPVAYIGSIVGIYFYINRLFNHIEPAYRKTGLKFIQSAQRSLVNLPRFYLVALPIYGLILPLTAQSNFYALFTFEFFMEWIFATAIIFISSTPFFISMVNVLEKSSQGIPSSAVFNDLNLEMKFMLISIPNIIGTFLVTVCSYILIFLRNDQNPDVVYVLLNKSVILAIIIIGIYIYNNLMLKNQILNPVKQLNEFMNNIIQSGGDINTKLQFTNRDEYRSIAVNFNRLLEFLKQMMLQVDLTAADVLNSSKKLTQTTRKLSYTSQKEHGAIHEISRFGQQLKEVNEMLLVSAEKSNKEIGLITESIHTINIETHEVIQSLEDLTEDIRKTATNAQVGEKSLADMRHTMEMLFNTFQDIAEVMSFTNEIAEKINLLSLNASIEAARAGELGHGFAVVAQQIARLSEETKKNVSNIEILLEKSSSKMKAGTEQILKGVQTIIFLLNGVDDIEKNFGKIIFGLKEDIKNYDELEIKVNNIQEISGSAANYTLSQGDRISQLMDSLANAEQFIKSSIDSLKELNTNAEHSLHFAQDLQKKVTQFHGASKEVAAAEPVQDEKKAG